MGRQSNTKWQKRIRRWKFGNAHARAHLAALFRGHRRWKLGAWLLIILTSAAPSCSSNPKPKPPPATRAVSLAWDLDVDQDATLPAYFEICSLVRGASLTPAPGACQKFAPGPLLEHVDDRGVRTYRTAFQIPVGPYIVTVKNCRADGVCSSAGAISDVGQP